MSTRTVRLDEESELVLQEIVEATGLPISAALKKGLYALKDEIQRNPTRSAFEIYRELDLGGGGWSLAPSSDTRRGVRDAIRRKLGR